MPFFYHKVITIFSEIFFIKLFVNNYAKELLIFNLNSQLHLMRKFENFGVIRHKPEIDYPFRNVFGNMNGIVRSFNQGFQQVWTEQCEGPILTEPILTADYVI